MKRDHTKIGGINKTTATLAYLARTSTLADRAIDKYENVLETEYAKRKG